MGLFLKEYGGFSDGSGINRANGGSGDTLLLKCESRCLFSCRHLNSFLIFFSRAFCE